MRFKDTVYGGIYELEQLTDMDKSKWPSFLRHSEDYPPYTMMDHKRRNVQFGDWVGINDGRLLAFPDVTIQECFVRVQ